MINKKVIINKNMTNNTKQWALLINIIVFCCNLAFTIGGSIILDQYNSQSNSDQKFFNVWLSNLILTIISGIQSFYLLFTCCGMTQIDSEDKTNNNQLIELINLGISIWVIVIFYDSDTDLSGLMENYYNLYFLLAARVYYTITLLSILGLILSFFFLALCIGGIYTLALKSEDEDDNASDIQVNLDYGSKTNNENSLYNV